jgi:hypothetical protein
MTPKDRKDRTIWLKYWINSPFLAWELGIDLREEDVANSWDASTGLFTALFATVFDCWAGVKDVDRTEVYVGRRRTEVKVDETTKTTKWTAESFLGFVRTFFPLKDPLFQCLPLSLARRYKEAIEKGGQLWLFLVSLIDSFPPITQNDKWTIGNVQSQLENNAQLFDETHPNFAPIQHHGRKLAEQFNYKKRLDIPTFNPNGRILITLPTGTLISTR